MLCTMCIVYIEFFLFLFVFGFVTVVVVGHETLRSPAVEAIRRSH